MRVANYSVSNLIFNTGVNFPTLKFIDQPYQTKKGKSMAGASQEFAFSSFEPQQVILLTLSLSIRIKLMS